MALEITGRLMQKLELQSGMGKNGEWKKQDFIIETMEQYPKKVCSTLWGNNIDMLHALNIGDTITISFGVESREFNGKWYTDIRTWKIVPAGATTGVVPTYTPAPQSATQVPTPAVTSSFVEEMPTFTDEEDAANDLPF